jgi:hypothetical protein
VSNDALAPFVAAIAGPIIERLDRLQAKVDALERWWPSRRRTARWPRSTGLPPRTHGDVWPVTLACAPWEFPSVRVAASGSFSDAEQVRRYRAAKVGK